MRKFIAFIFPILILSSALCKRQPTEAPFKPQIKYVKPLNGLWLRELPAKNAKKLFLLPYSMSIEISDSFNQKDLIDGISGMWRKVNYGAYSGYAFDAYLADDYAQLMKTNQYTDQAVNAKFLAFQGKTIAEQGALIDEIIKKNNTIGDPITGNRTGNHCLFGLEWRYCGGVIATKGDYSKNNYSTFLSDLKANILNPTPEFFNAHLKCIVMVGCYACDGGYFVAKQVLIPHLMNALRNHKIVSISDTVSETPGRKEYVIHAESATPLTDYQKHVTFLVNQEMGGYQIIGVLGDYSRNLRDTLTDKCYP